MKTLFTIVLIVVIVAMHMAISNLLPYPLNKTNVIIAFLILIMIWLDSGLVVWLSFLFHFIIELYAITPFGIILFSGTISTLLFFWTYKYVLTNRSLPAVFILSITAIIFYRLIYLILVAAYTIFFHLLDVSLLSLVIVFCWEIICTAAATSIIYFVFNKFNNRFNAAIIDT